MRSSLPIMDLLPTRHLANKHRAINRTREEGRKIRDLNKF
jgi:hypothetical protein